MNIAVHEALSRLTIPMPVRGVSIGSRWLEGSGPTLLARSPIDPIGVYFSPETRNFGADDFVASYRGILILLMQKHIEFQIVTPRTLADFHGRTLVLPDVKVLEENEKTWLQSFVAKGNKLVIAGADATGLEAAPNVARFPESPGKAYNTALEKDFEHAFSDSQKSVLDSLVGGRAVQIKAGDQVATSIARTSDGHTNCFFANFAGLVAGSNPIQTAQSGIEVSLKTKSWMCIVTWRRLCRSALIEPSFTPAGISVALPVSNA